jgi:hypothetical protein
MAGLDPMAEICTAQQIGAENLSKTVVAEAIRQSDLMDAPDLMEGYLPGTPKQTGNRCRQPAINALRRRSIAFSRRSAPSGAYRPRRRLIQSSEIQVAARLSGNGVVQLSVHRGVSRDGSRVIAPCGRVTTRRL